MKIKKSLWRLLIAPLDVIDAIFIGIKFRQKISGARIYIFDFDNTLVNTADLISEKQSYDYDIPDLSVYTGMRSYLLTRQRRGVSCLVLSARPRADKGEVVRRLAREGIEVPVELVRSHWLKAIVLACCSVFKTINIVVIDDMMRGEETGEPKKLFFPVYFLSKRVRLITHHTVLRIR